MAKHRKDSFRNASSTTRVANADIPATQIDEDPMANTSPFQVCNWKYFTNTRQY